MIKIIAHDTNMKIPYLILYIISKKIIKTKLNLKKLNI